MKKWIPKSTILQHLHILKKPLTESTEEKNRNSSEWRCFSTKNKNKFDCRKHVCACFNLNHLRF
jgi:hypothetical protein